MKKEKIKKNIKNFIIVLKVTFQYVIMIVLYNVNRRFATHMRAAGVFCFKGV